jgi:hypothetical protein
MPGCRRYSPETAQGWASSSYSLVIILVCVGVISVLLAWAAVSRDARHRRELASKVALAREQSRCDHSPPHTRL